MSPAYSVTIIGGSGGLGQYVVDAFLTQFRSSFSRVRVLTRDPASEKAQGFGSQGAELLKLGDGDVNQTLDVAFAGVDVIVNVLPGGASDDLKDAIVQAVARSSAKVYFPSEFGTDYRINDFPGYDHPEWLRKKKHVASVRETAKDKKVIAVYTSVFIEYAFGNGILGFDVPNNTYTAYGSPSQRVSFTSMGDIGRSVARLALLALDPTTAATVPDELRTAGSTVTFEEVRDIAARVKGVALAKINSEDLAVHKEEIRKHPGEKFLDYIRVIMGEGKADFSGENANELINPGEAFWKWKSAEDQIRQV